VQLLGEDYLTERKAFVSMDCMTWAQLPTVHPVIASSAKLIRKRFSGNMGAEFTVTEPGPSKDEAPIDLPSEAKAMRQVEEQDGGGTLITTTIKEEQVRHILAVSKILHCSHNLALEACNLKRLMILVRAAWLTVTCVLHAMLLSLYHSCSVLLPL